MANARIVSAHSGGAYYGRCAELLHADCDRFGLDHRIVAWDVPAGEHWIETCRRKVGFYLEQIEDSPDGIFWVDVDTRIVRPPEFLSRLRTDIAGFVRGFQYLRDFDPQQSSRFLIPGFLYFGPTPAAIAFLRLMAELERRSTERATDDYFLHEAWLVHRQEMSVSILPPMLLQRPGEASTDRQVLQIGVSGQAPAASTVAKQHAIAAVEASRRLTVLESLSMDAKRRGASADRIVYFRDIVRQAPADQERAIHLVRASKGATLEPMRQVLREAASAWKAPYLARREWLNRELERGDPAEAEALCADLEASPDAADRACARSRRYRLDLERRAAAIGIDKERRPKLWWMEQPFPGNFGDSLNPYVVEKLTGVPPLMVAPGAGALVIGSTIKFATEGTPVWGAGTPRMTDRLDPAARYLAVRGPLTRRLVIESGGDCPEVYGDPAWYLPAIYRPEVVKTHRLGVVRHQVHADRPVALDGAVKEISVDRVGDADIEAFIRELLACERVVSTSLHGLIVAHAYGLPAEWATFRDDGPGLRGDGTKFLDYFASVGVAGHEPIDLAAVSVVGEALAARVSRTPERGIDLVRLSAASPFALLAPFGGSDGRYQPERPGNPPRRA